MGIYEQRIFPSFEAELTFCPPACRANQQVLPGSDAARMMTVGSGEQCSMWLEWSSRLGAFSKILLASSHWTNSEEYCYVWERLDTRFGCSAFQLTPLGQSTDGSEYSLYATPQAHDAKQGSPERVDRQNGGGCRNLEDRLFRTPSATDWKGKSGPNCQAFQGGNTNRLSDQLGGSLNPRFVEQLMGFEVDHTDLEHWETLLCRKSFIHFSGQYG